MQDYPKNVSINADAKSRYWFVSFLSLSGRKRRSTKVPVAGGMFGSERLSKLQAKNRALIVGSQIAKDECMEELELNNVSIKDFLESYAQRRAPFISKATLINVRSAFKHLCNFLGKNQNMPIRMFSRDLAKGFIEYRRRDVRFASVKKDVSGIKAAFNDALDSEIINRNPFVRLIIPPDTRDEALKHEAFSLEEIRFVSGLG